MPEFIPGLELSRLFFAEAVLPLLQEHFPTLTYSAALIGSGSEVLGYDTPISTDHHWGPRLMLFLAPQDYDQLHDAIIERLSAHLPYTFRGYSTNFGEPDNIGVRLPKQITSGAVAHRVEPMTVEGFFTFYLGIDPRSEFGVVDWLSLPEQKLLTVTAGAVYHDGLGDLGQIRQKLAYYPHDLWLYLLACQWSRIAQEEAFVGRAGHVGDELGSQIIAGRLVRDMMKLCFMLEKRYAPYSKWFGTAFSRLQSAPSLTPIFRSVLLAPTWPEREAYLADAYRVVATLHNQLGLTQPLPTEVSPYYGRPYRVIRAEYFAAALSAAIREPEMQRLPFGVGALDQWVDSTDVLSRPERLNSLRPIWNQKLER